MQQRPTQELIALNEAFRDRQAARKFAEAILKFVDEGSEPAFSGLVEATGNLPADPSRARVLTWPIVTILPFLAKPDCHMFLKPMQTQRIAAAFSFDLLVFDVPEMGDLQPAPDAEQSTAGAASFSPGPGSDRRAVVHVGGGRFAVHETD